MNTETESEPVNLDEKRVDVASESVSESKEVGNDSNNDNAPAETQPSADGDATVTPGTVYPSGARLYLTLIALSFVTILGGLDFSIVGVAVPEITEQFHTLGDVGWYNVSYRLTACAFQFAWGKLYTIFSVKRALAASIAIFLAGSAISAAAVTSVMFVTGRAITGVGSAGVLAGVFTALMAVAPLHIRPVLTSLLGALEAVAMVTSPIIGGSLTQHASWRWCFYLNLPVGGVALLFLLMFLADTHSPDAEKKTLLWKDIFLSVDPLGNLFLMGSLISLFMALSWAGTNYPWSSGTIIGLLITFVVCLGLFAFDQYKRGDEAALSPRILKQRSVMAGFLFSCCLNGSLGVLEYYIPIYFQAVYGWDPTRAGYMMLPVTVGFNIGLLLQGFGTSWLGYYTPFMLLSSIIMPVSAGLITTWDASTDLARLIVYPGLIGFASGLAFEVPQIAVQTVLPEEDGALGISITLFAQNFGAAIFISVAQQVFASQLLANLRDKLPNIDPTEIQALGLVNLPAGLAGGGSAGVLDGLQKSFAQAWFIAVALASIMIVGSLTMEWRSVKEEEVSSV
ncbi:MFS general substrate transporter [Thozetella sp. PMI_491]|nr:MFS general substrate transporter [Thozetella sp. PMI_491]